MTRAHNSLGAHPRLLIVRLGAMGDVLHAMPAVAALRAAMPEAHLGWVIEPRWSPLLACGDGGEPRTASMPLVDRVHTAPARSWARRPISNLTWQEMRALRQALRNEHYDMAIDLQGAFRSALIGRAAGAPLVGEAEPRERPARWFFTRRVSTQGTHVIEQAAEVVSAAVGHALLPVLPDLPVDSAAEVRVAQLVPSDQPIALLHPGAGWGAKRWPAERYGAVAAALSTRGYRVVVNRAPGEEAIADAVVLASESRAFAVATSMGELIEMTRRSAIVIGGDTGPVHLACALGRPVVGIYGPTDPARNGPWGVPFRVLRHPESRRDHARRNEPEAGLLTITSDEVLEAASDLLRVEQHA